MERRKEKRRNNGGKGENDVDDTFEEPSTLPEEPPPLVEQPLVEQLLVEKKAKQKPIEKVAGAVKGGGETKSAATATGMSSRVGQTQGAGKDDFEPPVTRSKSKNDPEEAMERRKEKRRKNGGIGESDVEDTFEEPSTLAEEPPPLVDQPLEGQLLVEKKTAKRKPIATVAGAVKGGGETKTTETATGMSSRVGQTQGAVKDDFAPPVTRSKSKNDPRVRRMGLRSTAAAQEKKENEY